MNILKRFLILFSFVFAAFTAKAFSVDTLFICKNSCLLYQSTTTVGIAVAWEWSFQGGNPTSSIDQNPSAVCYPTAGVFLTTIKTTFDDNSDSTDSVIVVVYDNEIPDYYFPTDTGYCQGSASPITLTTLSFPRLTYQWNTGSNASSITVNSPGTYWVNTLLRAGNETCDSVFKQVIVSENPVPTVYLGQDRFMCQNQNLILDAGSGNMYTYQWLPGLEITQTLNVSLPGIYEVRVTNEFGCSASDEIELIDSCPHFVFMPNAVSPNEDGLNDLFVKVWNFTPKDYEFSIFNRWGELLFETDDLNAGWDCKVNGELVNQDIYIYRITYFDNDKKWYELRGTFFVVR